MAPQPPLGPDAEAGLHEEGRLPGRRDVIDSTDKTLTVLHVDDDEGDAELLRRHLVKIESFKCKFIHQDNVVSAMETLNATRVNVLLLDYQLGETTGTEWLTELRSTGMLLPIVVLTGQGDETVAAELMRLGADDYLMKSELTPDALRRSINFARTQYARRIIERENSDLLRELRRRNVELKTKNRRLAELYETAHEFVDNVSHEFRTPLTVVKEFASIIHDGLAGDVTEEQKEYLEIVLARTDDLTTMIDDMLDISKLEAGVLSLARSETSVDEILNRVRSTLERKADDGAISLEFRCEDNLPTVYCDAEKIGRVLINLTVNAVKFSPEGAKVAVAVRHEQNDDHVRFEISDKGPGIDPENLNVIFDRFKQIDGPVRASTKGFGLGLNIAKELVHLNFGDIHVESELGAGSVFSFTVPTCRPTRLVERFLDKVDIFRNGSQYVSLARVHADADAGDAALGEFETFLQHQIRRSDLVFRNSRTTWLLVAASNQRNLTEMFCRVEESRDLSNRNRPGQPLPKARFEFLTVRHLHDERDEFLDGFKNAFAESEPALA
jgi:hypothetical protein